MTGMVQPDLGPPATKYKEDSIDDPVSIISILRGIFFFFRVPDPLDFVRCFLLQYHSYLSWSFLYVVGGELLCPVGLPLLEHLDVYHDFGFRLLSTRLSFVNLDLVQDEQHCQYLNHKTAANSVCRH